MNDPKRSSPADDEPSLALERAGSHPLGTAAGAMAGAAVGAVGGLAAGPVGSLAGAVGGAVAGAAIGSGGTRATTSGPVVPTAESVAGEEDPGASVDVAVPQGGASPRPGDQAAPGTPGTGEAVCPRCGGSGRLGAAPCLECNGTGRITQGIGGA